MSVFGAADWTVFIGMFVISLTIAIINGILSRRKQRQLDEFLMGSRKLFLIPTAVSLMSSFISSVTILGFPADVYITGSQYIFIPLGWMIGGLVVAWLFVPLFYPLKITSVYEYLELRYQSKAVRKVGAAVGILNQVIYIAICIFGPCFVLEAMVGFEAWKSVLITGAVCILPTVIGGLKGVVWMDFFQGLVMYAALIAILAAAAKEVGGMNKAMSSFTRLNSALDTSTSHTRTTVWSALIGSIFGWIGHMGVSQSGFQRYCAVETINKSRIVVLLGLLIQASVIGLAVLCGVAIFGYFAGRGCDPFGTGKMTSPNSLVPTIVLTLLAQPGVPGLFMASIFSGAFSSVTSSLTAIAANLWEDVLKDCCGERSERFKSVTLRFLIVLAGLIGMALAYACIYASGSILQLAIAFLNTVTGPLAGLFILSAFFPQANKVGAIVGLLSALAFTLWMAVGAYVHVIRKLSLPAVANEVCPLPGYNTTASSSNSTGGASDEADPLEPLYEVNVYWYGLIAPAIVIVLGLLISCLTSRCYKKHTIQQKYLFGLVHGYKYMVDDEDDKRKSVKEFDGVDEASSDYR